VISGLTRTHKFRGTRAQRKKLRNRTLATRTVTPVEPPARLSAVEYRCNRRNRRNRRKPAPQKAIATSPRTSSNFTICRARRVRAHHRRAWKRGLTKSLPTLLARSCSPCGRLLAPGRRRREFDDFAVEAAVAVATSPPPPLLLLPLPLPLPPMFHSFTRRRTKILPPAGPFTRSRFSADSRRRSIPPRGETRFPPPDGHTKNRPSLSFLLSLFLALSFDEIRIRDIVSFKRITLCLETTHVNTDTPRDRSKSLTEHTCTRDTKADCLQYNPFFCSFLFVNFFFFFTITNIQM